VADIFISYSKQDQEQARLLAAFLGATALSLRLWRILIGVGLLVALNYATLWTNSNPGQHS